jgi:hypothetical protein
VDYKRSKKYFRGGSKLWIVCVVAGFFLGMMFAAISGVLLILCIIGGIVGAVFASIGLAIPDAEIDKMAKDAVADIKRDALNKLGLDEDEIKVADPIIVSGYNFPQDITDVMFRIGKDGTWRSSQYGVTVFFFTDQQVHCYERTFSLLKDESFNSTDEYFYRDIVSVSVAQGKSKVLVGKPTFAASRQQLQGIYKTVSYEYFKLTTSGGTSIEAVFQKSETASIERSIAAMRNLLKAKKQSLV